MISNKYLKNHKIILVNLALAVLVVVLPFSMRILTRHPLIPGEEIYYHIRLAKTTPLMVSKTFSPYYVALWALSHVFSMDLSVLLLSLTSALFSVAILYFLIRKELQSDEIFFTLLFFVVSPVFLYSFTTGSASGFSFFLLLLAIYLFSKKKFVLVSFSLIIFVALSLTSPVYAFASGIILLFYVILKKPPVLKSTFALLSIIVSAIMSEVLFSRYMACYTSYADISFLQKYIADLGGAYGFGVFTLLLAALGFLVTWRKKRDYLLLYLLIIVFMFTSGSCVQSNIILNLLLAILAAKGMKALISRKWDIEIVKVLSVAVILCGILFSVVSYTKTISNIGPDYNLIKALKWLSTYSKNDEVVLSHPNYGFWIEMFAHKRPVVEQSILSSSNYKSVLEDFDKVFYSRNLKKTKPILKNNNVSFVLVTPEMKQGVVWKRANDGLLFLFRNNETFKRIYSYQNVEIWQVLYTGDE